MTPEEVFRTLVHGVADRDFDVLPALYAEQTDVRHPMSPYGDKPLLTRDALREHFGANAPRVAETIRFQPENIRIHHTADPEVIVAEFGYEYSTPDGGVTKVPCIFVMRVRDGQIVESRDYIDPVRTARARGRIDDLIAALRRPRGP
jgi:uncharacterized protein